MENECYLTEQIITYLGNKRKLLKEIESDVLKAKEELGKEKISVVDLFSGSGVVSRMLKKHASELYANDFEAYSYIINRCYLANKEDFNYDTFKNMHSNLVEYVSNNNNLIEGVITKNYAPKDDNNIKPGERVFYTHKNAMLIDTIRLYIDLHIDSNYQHLFLAPLLYEASVHTNTSGVFKGFYKSKETKIGKFGGDGENALERITGKIDLKEPVLSNYSCKTMLYQEDSNELVKRLPHVDVAYLDPPYNQHPYGSNYFMLNTILENKLGHNISEVAGIPDDWNKSDYNKKTEALKTFDELISNLDASYIIISYNNEGFISCDEMVEMLSKYGEVTYRGIDYSTFKASRNLANRSLKVTEYLFTLKKN